MSYRLIDSNALAQTHPEVNDLPCIYADIDCLNGRLYDLREHSTLQAENLKLRELVKDIDEVADPFLWEFIGRRMRELGIEVEE